MLDRTPSIPGSTIRHANDQIEELKLRLDRRSEGSTPHKQGSQVVGKDTELINCVLICVHQVEASHEELQRTKGPSQDGGKKLKFQVLLPSIQ